MDIQDHSRPRLVILTESGEVVGSFSLGSGVCRIGRSDQNEVVISDPSVSGTHAEIEAHEGHWVVRDAGSTNGTFVDGQRVTLAEVQAGQVFRLGNIQVGIELGSGPVAPGRVEVGASPAAPVRVAVAAPRLRVSAAVTVERPGNTAAGEERTAGSGQVPPAESAAAADSGAGPAPELVCQKCGGLFAKAETKRYLAGSRDVYGCTRCGGFCVPIAAYEQERARQSLTFGQLVQDAFRYPLRGDGRLLLVLAGIVFGVLNGGRDLIEYVVTQSRMMPPMFIVSYLILTVAVTGYFFACLQGIIQTSASGEETMPDWPEVSTFWDEIFMPFFRFTMVFLLALGPGVVLQRSGFVLPGFALMLLGFMALPMILLAVACAESLGALNPVTVFSSIARIPGQYLLTCGILLGLLFASGLFRFALELTGIPFVPAFIAGFVSLYVSCVSARILGCLYYVNRHEFNWF
ncbi:MAG: FHA domain-containing protein [Verrucomicrobiales bacterium]|nr:FHA domain-containing protein [Verrucomicrobiales bacterium]